MQIGAANYLYPVDGKLLNPPLVCLQLIAIIQDIDANSLQAGRIYSYIR